MGSCLKDVTRNICLVNYIYLIKATEDLFSFRVVWGSVSKPCKVLCGVLIMDLLWLNSFKIER